MYKACCVIDINTQKVIKLIFQQSILEITFCADGLMLHSDMISYYIHKDHMLLYECHKPTSFALKLEDNRTSITDGPIIKIQVCGKSNICQIADQRLPVDSLVYHSKNEKSAKSDKIYVLLKQLEIGTPRNEYPVYFTQKQLKDVPVIVDININAKNEMELCGSIFSANPKKTIPCTGTIDSIKLRTYIKLYEVGVIGYYDKKEDHVATWYFRYANFIAIL